MLEVTNLSTTKQRTTLDGVSAQFTSGRIYTILGRTGAGKTELLRALMGLDEVAAGQIALDGDDLVKRPVRARQMAMVYQQFINYPHLNVLRNVAFPLRRQGVGAQEADARASEALELVGLGKFQQRMPYELSGGQQQRVALARAIVKKARILMLDEPLANLDYKLREQLREEFPRLLQDNADGIILYTTTEPAEAMQLGDEMIVMSGGRIVAQGDPVALFDNPPTIEVAQVISEPPISIFDGAVSGGRLTLADGTEIPAGGLRLPGSGPLQIGIRPDALSLDGDIPARISLTEFSGSETIVHLKLPFGTAVMLLDGIKELETGSDISVSLDPSHILLFGPDGRNVTERTG